MSWLRFWRRNEAETGTFTLLDPETTVDNAERDADIQVDLRDDREITVDGAIALRELGNSEKKHLAMYMLSQKIASSLTCVYQLTMRQKDPQRMGDLITTMRVVQRAITQTVRLHPFLRVGICATNSNHPRFVRLQEIDLSEHIRWRGEPSDNENFIFRPSTISSIKQSFGALKARPGWRVTISYENAVTLIITFDWCSAFADSFSGKVFHRSLLHYINSTTLDEACSPLLTRLQLPPLHQLLRPVEETTGLGLKFGWMTRLKALIREKCLNGSHGRDTLVDWAPIYGFPVTSYTLWRYIRIPGEDLAHIMGACTRNHTTLRGLVHGVALISLRTELRGTNPIGFRSCTAFNLRYASRIPDETVGNYMTTMGHIFPPSLVINTPDRQIKFIWEAARRARDDIEKKTGQGRSLTSHDLGIYEDAEDWRKQQRSALLTDRKVSWLLTDLGLVMNDHDKANPEAREGSHEVWAISRAFLVLSPEVTEAALNITMMRVVGGELVLGLSKQRLPQEQDTEAHFLSRMVRTMGRFFRMVVEEENRDKQKIT